MSRWAVGGVLMASLVVMLVSAAPVGAVTSETEPAMAEGPEPDVTTLVLEPVCVTDSLRRFAVSNVEGPDAQLTIAAAGGGDETMAIESGDTRHFWVEPPGAVEIAWDDGSATATGIDDTCTSDVVPTDAVPTDAVPPVGTFSAPSATDTPSPRPQPSASPSPGPTSEASVPPAASEALPSERGTPPAEWSLPPDAPETLDAPETSASTQAWEPPGDGGAATGASRTRREPRPRLLDGTLVCPDGWIPVDTDADGRFEASDTCELLVESAAREPAPGTALLTAALIVTIGLLVASIGLGTFRRQRV